MPEFTLSEKDKKRVQAALTYIEALMKAQIPGGKNDPRGPVFPPIGLGRADDRNPPADDWIWIKITGHTQDGTKKRWKYDWTEVYKSTKGYGGWSGPPGGLVGHTTDIEYAYNTIEDMNDTTGTWGDGVASTDLSGSLAIQPAPNGVIVRAFIVNPASLNSNGYPDKPELWFNYENGITGGCT